MRALAVVLIIAALAAVILWMLYLGYKARREEARARELHEIEKSRRIISGNYTDEEMRKWDDDFAKQWDRSNSRGKT